MYFGKLLTINKLLTHCVKTSNLFIVRIVTMVTSMNSVLGSTLCESAEIGTVGWTASPLSVVTKNDKSLKMRCALKT